MSWNKTFPLSCSPVLVASGHGNPRGESCKSQDFKRIEQMLLFSLIPFHMGQDVGRPNDEGMRHRNRVEQVSGQRTKKKSLRIQEVLRRSWRRCSSGSSLTLLYKSQGPPSSLMFGSDPTWHTDRIFPCHHRAQSHSRPHSLPQGKCRLAR